MEPTRTAPRTARLFVNEHGDGWAISAVIAFLDREWVYGELADASREQDLAHQWRTRLRVSWNDVCHEVWCGSDFWRVEEILVDDPPYTDSLVIPRSIEHARVEMTFALDLFTEETSPVYRTAWTSDTTIEIRSGWHDTALDVCAHLEGLPFHIPEPEIRVVERETFDAWDRELGTDEPPPYRRPGRGCFRRDPGTGRDVMIETMASEELGPPVAVLSVVGPIPEQALVLDAVYEAQLGFVPEGILVGAWQHLWLVPHGARIAQRVVPR